MICIRIFKTREEVEWAKGVLEEGRIYSTISEDTFNGIPIQKFGVRARFRLKIHYQDYTRVANFLAAKLKRTDRQNIIMYER